MEQLHAQPRPKQPRAESPLGAILLGLLGGLVVAVAATFTHRNGWGEFPWGLILGIGTVMVGAFFMRTVAWVAAGSYLAAVVAVLVFIKLYRPGGDEILLADLPGWIFVAGSGLAVLGVALLPGSLFRSAGPGAEDVLVAGQSCDGENDG